MLDNTARYVYEVYRLKSVSQAANALFISQPAISAAIRKAEKEFGSPIFNRKTLPFTLTEEGKIYIEAVEKMLGIQDLASSRLRELQQLQGGTLRIAAGDPISYRLIPKLLRLFHEQYPQVDAHILESNAERVYELMDRELADVVFSPLEPEQDTYPLFTLFSQRSVVVLPETAQIPERLRSFAVTREELLGGCLPPAKLVTDPSFFQGVDFLHIAAIPFIVRRRTQLFGKYEVAPHITSGTSRTYMNYNLMRSGFGALLTTDAQLAVIPRESGCLYFALGGPNALQPYSVACSAKNSTPQQAFLKMVRDYFSDGDPLKKIIDF